MQIKKLIAASAAAVMLASNQTAMAGVSYAAEAVAESQIVYGEVNGDGKVSLSDAVAILQYIANRDKYPLSAKAVLNADCVDHGDGVTGMDALALKLIDANMLKAEDLPVTSQKIQECLNPPTSEEALLFDEVYTFGVYNAETKTIDIEWLVNETVKEVEIFVSDDNQKYVSVAKVKDEAKYSYEVKEDFDTKFFKVSYTDKEGKLHESFPFFIKAKEDNYVTEFFDADEDGIFDMFESAYGCKIDEADTDKDGLSDYEEVYITQTDPAVSDSFKKGVSDADADCDEDGISNITELKNGSNPIRKDTDYDGLTDLEEINELKTNPLLRDTDEDGLTDYAERKMGLDPLKPETNGVPDADVVIEQKIDSDAAVLQAVNEDDSNKAYKLSVDMKTAGFAEDNISVSKSSYTNAINSKPLVGGVMDIVIDDSKELDSMKLNFIINDEAKENKLGTYSGLGGIKRLSVFQYNEDIHMLIPMDTEYSEAEGIVSAEIDGTGTYCLVDSEIWFDSHGIMPEEDVPEAPDTESLAMASVADAVIEADNVFKADSNLVHSGVIDVYFALQTGGDEGDSNFLYQKKIIHDLSEYLFNNYDDVVIHVVPYSNETEYDSKGKLISSMPTTFSASNLAELAPALDKIKYRTNIGRVFRAFAYERLRDELANTFRPYGKRFFINLMQTKTRYMTESDTYFASNEYTEISYFLRYPISDDVYMPGYRGNSYFYEIGKQSSYYNDYYNTIYGSGGEILKFNQQTNYNDLLSSMKKHLNEESRLELFSGSNSFTASDIDSDGDGISDLVELDSNYLIQNADGSFSFMTYSNVFKKANISVGKKKDGKNIPSQWRGTSHGNKINDYYEKTTVAVWISDPENEDSDYDGIPDAIDNAPRDRLDDHFQVVSDYSKVTYMDLLSYGYEKVMYDSQSVFETVKMTKEMFADLAKLNVLAAGGMTGLSSLINGISFVEDDLSFVDVYGSTPNASFALQHFIEGKGTDFYLKRFPYAIAYTTVGRSRYYDNMNSFFDMVEKNTMIGHEYDFSTVKDIEKPRDVRKDGILLPSTWKCDYHDLNNTYSKNASIDWWLTIGGGQNALASKVSCYRNDSGDIMYHATIKYYLLDYYDWDDNGEIAQSNLHKSGLARSFLSYGLYETEIEWKKGKRYPGEQYGNARLCADTILPFINDSSLKDTWKKADKYYSEVTKVHHNNIWAFDEDPAEVNVE